jgi:hypothetical protein
MELLRTETESEGERHNQPPSKDNTQLQYAKLLEYLQEIRHVAWQNATKYRYDPTMGAVHGKYLSQLNDLLMEMDI